LFQKKKPIIARDISVFREVAGEYAFYFPDNEDHENLAEKIKEWLLLYKNNEYPNC
jgi:glycosyltransferase involved in cell wall biosynthesis